MDSFKGQTTPHQPLVDPLELRLVRLHAAAFDEPVRCDLEHVSLDASPNYFALSYTWGDAGVTAPICLGGQELHVTVNLVSFLRHFQAIIQAVARATPPPFRLSPRQLHEVLYLALRHLPPGSFGGPQQDLADELMARVLRPLYDKRKSLLDWMLDDCWWLDNDSGYESDDVSVYIWIDALCINQTDLAERSREVARMRYIYSKSTFLAIWLGSPGDGSTEESEAIADAFAFVESVVRSSQSLLSRPRPVVQNASNPPPPLDAGETDVNAALARLPERHRHMYNQLAALLERDWFRRVWCIQELAMARHAPAVLCGWYSTCWETLCQAAGAMYLITQNHPQAARFSEVARNTIKLRTTREKCQQEKNKQPSQNKGVVPLSSPERAAASDYAIATKLYNLVVESANHKATEPRDRLYALIGLLLDYGADEACLPEDLRPDYTKPLADVYKAYAYYIIKHTGRLDCLGVRASVHSGGCSWVPYWPDLRLAAIDGPSAGLVLASHVELLHGGRHLELEGVSLGRFRAVCQLGSFGSILQTHRDFVRSKIGSPGRNVDVLFHNGAFRLAPVLLMLEATLASLCRRCSPPVNFSEALNDMLETHGCSVERAAYEQIVGRSVLDTDSEAVPRLASEVLALAEALEYLEGSFMGVLDDGHVVLGVSPDRAGSTQETKLRETDTVCMFKGAPLPWCLRRTEDGKGWRLLELVRHGSYVTPGMDFYNAAKVERFVLV